MKNPIARLFDRNAPDGAAEYDSWRPQAAASQPSTALTPMSPELMAWFGNPSSSGKSVTEDSAQSLSAAFACQRILSEVTGMVSWSMYEKRGKNAEQADDHWLQDVLVHSPNAEMTDTEYRETLTYNLTGNGNCYSIIDRFGKRVTSLMPVPSANMRPKRKIGGNTTLPIPDGAVFYEYNDRGKWTPLPREKVWHVKGFGRDGLVGLSPIGAAREAMGGALAMQDFANLFFRNGGFPSGTVSYPGWLTKEQREVARDTLSRMIGGLGNAHKFALFEGGVKPEPWESMSLEDMQFIVGRKFSVLEVCRFFRVPPHMVAELEKGASYASIEQMSMDFVTFTMMPYFTRFERSVSKWLLPPEERRRYYLRFNYESLLRADSAARASYLSVMVNNGLMNRNEARAKENLNASTEKNMDAFTVQSAMLPISKLGEKPPAAPGAPGQPGKPGAPKPPAEDEVKE